MSALNRRATKLSLKRTIKPNLGICVALLCIGAAPVTDDKPMLWEGTTQTVFDKLLDPEYADKWTSRVGPPETTTLCLKPFRPKLGKMQRTDVDCTYTSVSNRGGDIFRRHICKGDPPSSFVTIITGKETVDAYDLLHVITVRDDGGKKLWLSKLRQTGRRIGECPVGMPIAQ